MISALQKKLFQLLAGSVLLMSASEARAQLAPDSARLIAKVAVVRLFARTYQAEAEYRFARNLSLSVTPRVVAGTVPSSVSVEANTAGDRVKGFGVSIGPRFYIPGTGTYQTRLTGLYLGLSADYQHLRLNYEREAWGEDLAGDGLYYYTFRPRTFSETITRYGGVVTLGYQSQVFHPRLRLDASANLNSLNSRSSGGADSRYRTSKVDYGYSGSFFSLGLSMGYTIK